MARPNSIKAVGLKKHLNSTKDDHNGFDYEDFDRMMKAEKRPSVASMAKIFDVSDRTLQKWIYFYEIQ